MSLPKIQNHTSPVKCYREICKFRADPITEKVNESFELSECIFWSLLGSFSSTQGCFLWVLPTSFLMPLSQMSSSEAAACLSTQQRLAALLPPSFLLQINTVLFVLILPELYFHLAGQTEQSCKILSTLRKKQQCSCACPVQHFQHALCCGCHRVSCKLLRSLKML